MRAPLQILAIPYKFENGTPKYCILHRADCDLWQFIAGGGEDAETPQEAAKREIWEEGGIKTNNLIPLKSMCYIPVEVFPKRSLWGWADDLYIIPEYAFAFACEGDIVLSHEHETFLWVNYDEAIQKLLWDSNKTALYDLNRILLNQKNQ